MSEHGDLEMALVEVPESDPRPAFDPSKHSLKERDMVKPGKGPEGAE